MSNSPLTVNPHIYKKGKIFEFKRLNEGVDRGQRNYIFSGKTGNNSLNTIVSATNNLNQITGRCLLGIYNLLSYFGLSKDPSEKLSKAPSVFDKFPTFIRRGDDKRLEEIKNLIVLLSARIEKLEAQIGQLKIDRATTRNEVVDFSSKLKEINENLRKVLG